MRSQEPASTEAGAERGCCHTDTPSPPCSLCRPNVSCSAKLWHWRLGPAITLSRYELKDPAWWSLGRKGQTQAGWGQSPPWCAGPRREAMSPVSSCAPRPPCDTATGEGDPPPGTPHIFAAPAVPQLQDEPRSPGEREHLRHGLAPPRWETMWWQVPSCPGVMAAVPQVPGVEAEMILYSSGTVAL